MIMSGVLAFTDRPELLMAVMDKLGNLLWTNSAFASFGNYAVGEAIAQNFWQILSFYTSSQDLIPYIHEQISKGEGFRFEVSYFKPSNQEVWRSHFLIDGQPIYNPDGNIQEYTVLGTGITSQKQTEADLVKELEPKKLELRESERLITTSRYIGDRHFTESALNQGEAKLKAFLDNSPAVVYIKDLEDRYQWVNKEFENVLKFPTPKFLVKLIMIFSPAKLRINSETMITNLFYKEFPSIWMKV
jgi:PAS domain-containing protein